MLIGIDASRANQNHKNGTEWYSYYLIRQLARLDDKNEYILYTNSPLIGGLADLTKEVVAAEEKFKPAEYDKLGFQVIKSPFNNFKAKVLNWPWQNFWTLGRLSLELLFARRPDILFVPAVTLPFFTPKKTLVTIHDIGFCKDRDLYECGPLVSGGPWSKGIFDLLIRIFTLGKYRAEMVDYLRWSAEHAVKQAAQVITVSENSRQDILAYYPEVSRKINVIHNGYNSELFQKVTDKKVVDEALHKYGIDVPFLFYVGKIGKKRNISRLIEAFSLLKEKKVTLGYKLVLVGDAFYGYDEVRYLIEEFDLESDVIMPGWVDLRDMPSLYSAAAVFVFPSNYEAFGIALLEAMSCETPIAASNVSSIPEVVGDAGLLFDQSTSSSIAMAVERIITDQELRQRLIEAGKTRIRNFSWEKCAQETLALINKL